MFKGTLISLAAIPMLCASLAWAADTPQGDKPPVPTAAERALMHRDMCSGRYGHEVGRLASLETRLQLTDQQRSAWNAWSKGMSGASVAERDRCLADKPKGDTKPTALEMEARMEQHMSEHLQAMQANRANLEALYNMLTPDQKHQFDRFFLPPPHRHGVKGPEGGMRD